jgi:hypothetical protein
MATPSAEELKKLNEYLESLDPSDVSVIVDTTDVGDINITVTPKEVSSVDTRSNVSMALIILASIIILFFLVSLRI